MRPGDGGGGGSLIGVVLLVALLARLAVDSLAGNDETTGGTLALAPHALL